MTAPILPTVTRVCPNCGIIFRRLKTNKGRLCPDCRRKKREDR